MKTRDRHWVSSSIAVYLMFLDKDSSWTGPRDLQVPPPQRWDCRDVLSCLGFRVAGNQIS